MYRVQYVQGEFLEITNGQEISIDEEVIIKDKNKIVIYKDDIKYKEIDTYGLKIDENSRSYQVKSIVDNENIEIEKSYFTNTEDEKKKITQGSQKAMEEIDNKMSLDEIQDIFNSQKEEIIKSLKLVLQVCDEKDKEQYQKYLNNFEYSGIKRKLLKGKISENLDYRLQLTLEVMLTYPKKVSSVINDFGLSKGEKYLFIENALYLNLIASKLSIYMHFLEDKAKVNDLEQIIPKIKELSILLQNDFDKIFCFTNAKTEIDALIANFKMIKKDNLEDVNVIFKKIDLSNLENAIDEAIKKF